MTRELTSSELFDGESRSPKAPLSAQMLVALEQLERAGFVFGGVNTHNGREFYVFPNAVSALERRGYGVFEISPDGHRVLKAVAK